MNTERDYWVGQRLNFLASTANRGGGLSPASPDAGTGSSEQLEEQHGGGGVAQYHINPQPAYATTYLCKRTRLTTADCYTAHSPLAGPTSAAGPQGSMSLEERKFPSYSSPEETGYASHSASGGSVGYRSPLRSTSPHFYNVRNSPVPIPSPPLSSSPCYNGVSYISLREYGQHIRLVKREYISFTTLQIHTLHV